VLFIIVLTIVVYIEGKNPGAVAVHGGVGGSFGEEDSGGATHAGEQDEDEQQSKVSFSGLVHE
jgi:hypothetical protein